MIIARGKATHLLNDKEYPLLPGDVYFIRPGDRHGFVVEEPDVLAEVNVLFVFDRLDLNLRDITAIPGFHAMFTLEPALRRQTDFSARLRLNPEELKAALDIVDKLECELAREEPGYQIRSITLFVELLIFLSRSYSTCEVLDTRKIQRIGEAVSFIENNLSEPLTVAQLAEKAQCTTNQLREIFHRAYGIPPLEYLTRVRVNRAMDLLRDSDLTVTRIAFDCGFNDSNYFTRTFRKHTGSTPSAYRKTMGLTFSM
jgi:AraC-like DNA-binding protein